MRLRQTYRSSPLRVATTHDKGITRARANVLSHYVGTELVVPAFTVESTWLGASHVILQYNYLADQPFVIGKYPLDNNAVALLENCCVIVAWRIGSVKKRYKLNWNVNEKVPACNYSGEIIPVNFTIEIWNTPIYLARLSTAYNLVTTMWRERTISEIDSTLVDKENSLWTGSYNNLKATNNLLLPLAYVSDVQHLNN